MRANVEHNHVLHEHVVILSDRDRAGAPRTGLRARPNVDALGYANDGIIHVTANFGYMETPNVPDALRLLDPSQTEGRIAARRRLLLPVEASNSVVGAAPTMAPWRKRLFIATSHITADAAEHFGLPHDRTVIMGSRIEV